MTSTEKPRFDPADYLSVYTLAQFYAGAEPRQLMRLSIEQIGGIVNFAADSGRVLVEAIRMIAAIDKNATEKDIRQARENLIAAVRPLMGEKT